MTVLSTTASTASKMMVSRNAMRNLSRRACAVSTLKDSSAHLHTPPQHKHGKASKWRGDRTLREDTKDTIQKSKRAFHDLRNPSSHKDPKILVTQSSSSGIIDPYLGNLLDGFCNGSCCDVGRR